MAGSSGPRRRLFRPAAGGGRGGRREAARLDGLPPRVRRRAHAARRVLASHRGSGSSPRVADRARRHSWRPSCRARRSPSSGATRRAPGERSRPRGRRERLVHGALALEPGTYRARVAPGRGYAVGSRPCSKSAGMKLLAARRAALAALVTAAPAQGARFAVGLEPGRVAARVAARRRRSPASRATLLATRARSRHGALVARAAHDSRRRLGRAARRAAAPRLHADRSARAGGSGTSSRCARSTPGPSSAAARRPARRRDRLRDRRRASRPPRPDRGRPELRPRRAHDRPAGARDVRRRADRSPDARREGDRGDRVRLAAPHRQGRAPEPARLDRGRGRGRSAGRSTTARA